MTTSYEGPAEVKDNGYLYPCEVIKWNSSLEGQALVEFILPGGFKRVTDVKQDTIIPGRAHRNSSFDPTTQKKQQSEEFLYPIGSKVIYQGDSKDWDVIVSGYDSTLRRYSLMVDSVQEHKMVFLANEDRLKPRKKVEESAVEIKGEERKQDKAFFPKFKINDLVEITKEDSKHKGKQARVSNRNFNTESEKYIYRVDIPVKNGKKKPIVKVYVEDNLKKVRVSTKQEMSSWTVAAEKRKFQLNDKVVWTRRRTSDNKIVRQIEAKITGWRYNSKLDEVLYTIEADVPHNPSDHGMGVTGFAGIKEDALELVTKAGTEDKYKPGDRIIFKPTSANALRTGVIVAKDLRTSFGNKTFWLIKHDSNLGAGYDEPMSHEESFFDLLETIKPLPGDPKFKAGDRVIVSGMYKGTVLKHETSGFINGSGNYYIIKWDSPMQHESPASEKKMELLDEKVEAEKAEAKKKAEEAKWNEAPKFNAGDHVKVKVSFHPERYLTGVVERRSAHADENRWLVKYDVSGSVWSVIEKNMELIPAEKVKITKDKKKSIIDELIEEGTVLFNDAFKETKLDQQPDFKEFINRIGEVKVVGDFLSGFLSKDDDKK